jgi:transcriptional regulator with XRE-family HTH domain
MVNSGHPHLTAVSTAASYPDWLSRLRSITVDAGMSVYRLGSLAGLSQSHLKKILTGEVENPRPETLAQLAAVTEKSLEWILHGDEVVEIFEVGLTEPQVDALKACAFLDDSDLKSLIREAVVQFVEERRADPDVSEMLARLQRRREARSAAVSADQPGAS